MNQAKSHDPLLDLPFGYNRNRLFVIGQETTQAVAKLHGISFLAAARHIKKMSGARRLLFARPLPTR